MNLFMFFLKLKSCNFVLKISKRKFSIFRLMFVLCDYQTFSVIGCVSHTDCPNQKACINSMCVDPCHDSSRNPCAHDQECQVKNHQPVCVRGKSTLSFLELIIQGVPSLY